MTGPHRDEPAEQPEPGTPVVPGTDAPADPTTGQPVTDEPAGAPDDDTDDGKVDPDLD